VLYWLLVAALSLVPQLDRGAKGETKYNLAVATVRFQTACEEVFVSCLGRDELTDLIKAGLCLAGYKGAYYSLKKKTDDDLRAWSALTARELERLAESIRTLGSRFSRAPLERLHEVQLRVLQSATARMRRQAKTIGRKVESMRDRGAYAGTLVNRVLPEFYMQVHGWSWKYSVKRLRPGYLTVTVSEMRLNSVLWRDRVCNIGFTFSWRTKCQWPNSQLGQPELAVMTIESRLVPRTAMLEIDGTDVRLRRRGLDLRISMWELPPEVLQKIAQASSLRLKLDHEIFGIEETGLIYLRSMVRRFGIGRGGRIKLGRSSGLDADESR